jgi:hypothetical protein
VNQPRAVFKCVRKRRKEPVAAEAKFLIDPYLEWAKEENIPMIDDFGVDLLTVEIEPWARMEAGDVAIVHNNCVHQHFNRNLNKPARALVLKTKPMFMFMNMLFQQTVEPRPKEPTPEGVGFVPRGEGDA